MRKIAFKTIQAGWCEEKLGVLLECFQKAGCRKNSTRARSSTETGIALRFFTRVVSKRVSEGICDTCL